MKKLTTLFMTSLMIVSCNSQVIDLETLKFDEQISESIKKINEIEQGPDPGYALKSYGTDKIENFKFGDFLFSNFSVPNGYAYSKNNIYIHVDNFNENKYLGFSATIVKDEESIALINYLKKKFGEPEERDTNNGIAFFWQVKQPLQWVFLKQYKENNRDDKKYLHTDITVIKQGVRVENTTNTEVFTILQHFTLSNPKK